MPRRILTFLLLLLLSAQTALAAGLRDVVNALENPFREGQIKDYSADFFQEAKIASLDRLQRARGQVAVRFDYRGGGRVPLVMFRWEYAEPTTQEIVSDGKTLWVYLPENNQVIQSDIETVSKARENDPMTFLTGLGNLSRDFLISWAEPNRDINGNYVLDLKPRRSSALLNRMVIVVDRYTVEKSEPLPVQDTGARDKSPVKIEPPARAARPGSVTLGPEPRGGSIFPILSTTVYDPNGNSTTIEFRDVRVNRGLSAGQFNFIRPAGVEVVRPTGKEMGF